jgi:hypothetical protein
VYGDVHLQHGWFAASCFLIDVSWLTYFSAVFSYFGLLVGLLQHC